MADQAYSIADLINPELKNQTKETAQRIRHSRYGYHIQHSDSTVVDRGAPSASGQYRNVGRIRIPIDDSETRSSRRLRGLPPREPTRENTPHIDDDEEMEEIASMEKEKDPVSGTEEDQEKEIANDKENHDDGIETEKDNSARIETADPDAAEEANVSLTAVDKVTETMTADIDMSTSVTADVDAGVSATTEHDVGASTTKQNDVEMNGSATKENDLEMKAPATHEIDFDMIASATNEVDQTPLIEETMNKSAEHARILAEREAILVEWNSCLPTESDIALFFDQTSSEWFSMNVEDILDSTAQLQRYLTWMRTEIKANHEWVKNKSAMMLVIFSYCCYAHRSLKSSHY